MSKKETALMLTAIAGVSGTLIGIEKSNNLSSQLESTKTELLQSQANEGKATSQIFEEKWIKNASSIRKLASNSLKAPVENVSQEIAENWQNVAIDRVELNEEIQKLQNVLDKLSQLDGSEADKYLRLSNRLQNQIDKTVVNYKLNSAHDEGGFAKHQQNLDELQRIVDNIENNLKLQVLKADSQIPTGE